MDLHTADVSGFLSRHRRRMEIEAYNQALDQYRRDQAAEIIRIQNEKEGELSEKESDDIESKIAATQTAAFSAKGVAFDVAKGNYRADEILKTATFGGLMGSKEEIAKRRQAYKLKTMKTTGGPKPGVRAVGEGLTQELNPVRSVIPEPPPIPKKGIPVRRLPTAETRAISDLGLEGNVQARINQLGGREGARVGKAGKSITGKALDLSGDIAKAGKFGTTAFLRHSGSVLNIGWGAMDLIEDIDAGHVVGDSEGEKISNVLQVGSGVAELGSLGAGALIGAGVLGAAAAPVVIGLGVLGAGLGIGSAVAEAVGVVGESVEEQKEIRGAESSQIGAVRKDIAEFEREHPRKLLEQAGRVVGGTAPKLLG
jgi:hypothetical protein